MEGKGVKFCQSPNPQVKTGPNYFRCGHNSGATSSPAACGTETEPLQHLAAGRVLVRVVRAGAAGKGQHAIANIAH